jgi:hypothetical protein
MNARPPVDAAMSVSWCGLVDELDRWREDGHIAALWWRDDDAVTATPQLDRLLRLAGTVPVGLAVIPALAQPELAAALEGAPQVAVLQHGWQHADRAAHGKKSEYAEGRSAAVVGAEIGAGRARLRALFGARAIPVFVPPWNRFATALLPLLVAAGMTRLSTMARPSSPVLPSALAALDVHLDLADWRGGRGFIGMEAALAGLIGCLRARRLARDGAAGPIGILTHHRVMDAATGDFLARLIAMTAGHAGVRWASAAELIQ